MNSYLMSKRASHVPLLARGISRTMIVMMIARMASISASKRSVFIFTPPNQSADADP